MHYIEGQHPCKSIVLDDRKLFYTGIIFIDDVKSWLQDLNIDNIKVLHKQLVKAIGR